MTSKELVKAAVAAIEEKKGEDIKVIDISGVSVIADYFILAREGRLYHRKLDPSGLSGRGDPHLQQ